MSKQLIIESRILHDWDFCKMCLVKIYERQTDDEQQAADVIYENGRGFTKSDAGLTAYAELIITGTESFTDRVKNLVGRRMVKYAKQLSQCLTEDEVES